MLSNKALLKLKQLKNAYESSFKVKRNDLLESWKSVESSGWSQPAVEDLRQHVHRLAGSAAFYGFEKISLYATKLEECLLLIKANPTPQNKPDAQLKNELKEYFAKLLNEL